MFDRNQLTSLGAFRRTGYVTYYNAEEKFEAAIEAHDLTWLEHKELCADERLRRLEDNGVTTDQKLLKKELEKLEKSIDRSAYHNDGWLSARNLEYNQYDMVIDMLTYRALCKLQK